MATKKQIETLLEQLEKAPPSAPFEHLDKNAVGIQAILKYLCETNETVTAGKISERLKISTARVAVLLKKMAAKDLIAREQAPGDARIVIVKITAHGRETAVALKEDLYKSLGKMIDTVGMERMLEFAEISNEIHAIMKVPDV